MKALLLFMLLSLPPAPSPALEPIALPVDVAKLTPEKARGIEYKTH